MIRDVLQKLGNRNKQVSGSTTILLRQMSSRNANDIASQPAENLPSTEMSSMGPGLKRVPDSAASLSGTRFNPGPIDDISVDGKFSAG